MYQKVATINGKYCSIAQNSITSLGSLFEREGDKYYSYKDYYSALKAYNNALSCFGDNSNYVNRKINNSIAMLNVFVEEKIPGKSKKRRKKKSKKTATKFKKILSKDEIVKIYKDNIVSIERKVDSNNSHSTGIILHTTGKIAYVLTTI